MYYPLVVSTNSKYIILGFDWSRGVVARAEKVIAFRESEPTFQALEHLKRRHARSWPELTLKGIVRAFGGASEEDAQDCRQVEDELHGEAPAGQVEPVEAVAETTGAVAESTEPEEVSETPAREMMPIGQASGPQASNAAPQKLLAAVVTCKRCGQRMTRGTMVVKRAEGYYHAECLAGAAATNR